MDSLLLTVLRDPDAVVDRLSDPRALAREAPALLLVVGGGAALLGAAVGLHRDAVQLVYAAVKLPGVLLLPLLVAVPAVRALAAAWGPAAPPVRAAAAGLVGMAVTAILAAGAAPAVWLAMSAGLGYSGSVLLLAATLAACGLPGLRVLANGVAGPGAFGRIACWGGAAVLYGAVAAQTGWNLRPFVVRPERPVVFLRSLEGSAFTELARHTSRPAGGERPAPEDPAAGAAEGEAQLARLCALGYLGGEACGRAGKGRGAPEGAAEAAEGEALRAVGYVE